MVRVQVELLLPDGFFACEVPAEQRFLEFLVDQGVNYGFLRFLLNQVVVVFSLPVQFYYLVEEELLSLFVGRLFEGRRGFVDLGWIYSKGHRRLYGPCKHARVTFGVVFAAIRIHERILLRYCLHLFEFFQRCSGFLEAHEKVAGGGLRTDLEFALPLGSNRHLLRRRLDRSQASLNIIICVFIVNCVEVFFRTRVQRVLDLESTILGHRSSRVRTRH